MKKLIFVFLALVITQNVKANEQQSTFSTSQKFDQEGVELYDSNLDLKAYKTFGLGIATGGLVGKYGVNFELNLQPQDSAFMGIGKGDGYASFNMGWKRNFESLYLSPYTKLGYSKWFNAGAGSARNSTVLSSVLSDSQMDNNEFSADFIAAGAGLEYNQLEGNLSGVNFFGEIMMMGEVNKSIFIPTLGLGLTYFY